MAIVENVGHIQPVIGSGLTNAEETQGRFHRIDEVRQEQGVSIRSAARQMECDSATVKTQERASSDLRISDLRKWQKVLNVPMADLLEDPGSPLSRPVMERARLVRVMKTVAAIREQCDSPEIERMATMLFEQLVDIMPELKEVSAWHTVGQRRSLEEYGRVVERRLRDDTFSSH